MKKKLLFTTALVALVSASNVYAADEIVINTDKSIAGIDVGDKVNDNSQNTQKLTVTNGARLDIFKTGETKNLFNVNGGKVEINDGEIHSEGAANISGGEITINGGELTIENQGAEMNISGGTINISSHPSQFSGFGVEISDDNPTDGLVETSWGPVEMTGGTINVSGKTGDLFFTPDSPGNYITGTEVNISGGELNINENSGISVIKGYKSVDNDIASLEKGIINLTDAGTINLSGTLVSDVSGNGNLNVKSSSALVDGNVSGSNLTFEADHSLSKAFSGTIGDLASLNVNKGTLTYDKQTGKIGNLNIAGDLDIGTNTVNATNVDFKDNSTLKFTVAGKEDGSYGKIKADTINVSTIGTKLDLTLNSSVLGKDETKEFTILDGTVTNDFAELSQNSRYKFEKVGNGVYKITGTATATDTVVEAGGTANNAGTATAWDSVSLDNPSGSVQGRVANVLADLAGKTDTTAGKKAYVDALTAVAPEVAPAIQQTSTETANQVFGAVSTRLTGGSISTGSEGMSSGDSNPDAAVWVQGMFNKSKLDDTSKAKGFDADSNGVALGIEKFINKDVKVGAGYAYTNTDIDGFMRSTDVDTHTAILYGEYKPSNWYVNGIATYGWSDYSEDKNVADVGVKADYDVETFGLQAMTGYDMNVNGLGITPEAGLRYVHIKQDAYKDSADQRISANDSDILTGVIGAKVSKNFELSNGMNIKPEARIAATYDLFNDDVNSVVTLANGSAYAVEGEALDRFGMEFGAGVTAEVNSQVELSLGYEGKFREDYQDHTGLINAKYKF
jgi:outer membrane autotransporter barrel domain protein